VKIINEYAFLRGYALAEASFPKVERIGYGAFDACDELTRLFLPAAPPELRPSAQECNLFNLWNVEWDDDWKKREDTLFIYVNGDEDAVAKYTLLPDKGGWGVAASVGASPKTGVYGAPAAIYYHKPVNIEALVKYSRASAFTLRTMPHTGNPNLGRRTSCGVWH
jgi:hypothetical protein